MSHWTIVEILFTDRANLLIIYIVMKLDPIVGLRAHEFV